MPTSRYQDKVLETYARSLLEAAKAENHVFEDLEMVERLASASPEIIAVLDTMSKRDQLDPDNQEGDKRRDELRHLRDEDVRTGSAVLGERGNRHEQRGRGRGECDRALLG